LNEAVSNGAGRSEDKGEIMRSVLLTILTVLSGVFAVQNVAQVPITFIVWHTETYLAVAILAALLLGFLSGAVAVLPWGMRARKAAKGAHKRLAELEARAATPVTPPPAAGRTVATGDREHA